MTKHYSGKIGEFDYDDKEFRIEEDHLFYIGTASDGSDVIIPEGVTECSYLFFRHNIKNTMKNPPVIPESVTDCSSMFSDCANLETAPVIPANANKLFITLPDTTGQNLRILYVSYHNSESLQTSVAGVTACKYENFKTYDSTSFGDSGTTLTIDLSSEKPSSAESICLYINAIYGVPASSITDPIILEFSNETTEN